MTALPDRAGALRELVAVHPAQLGDGGIDLIGAVWLATRTPLLAPYPCRCREPNSRGQRGGCIFKCPCNGRRPEPHLPVTCCSRRTYNPEGDPRP